MILYDDIDANNIPADATVMAGYVDGRWPSYLPMKQRFPSAQVFSITVYNGDADILDVETGDATPDMAPPWVKRQRANGNPRPIVYCNASTYPAVVNAFQLNNEPLPAFWIASYDNDPTIPDYAEGKQYQSLPNYDISNIKPTWPGLRKDNMSPNDFFRHFQFKEGGYINLKRSGEADIPPGGVWHPYSVLRADGAEYSFPYGAIWMYSGLAPADRRVADPSQDYIVDVWEP